MGCKISFDIFLQWRQTSPVDGKRPCVKEKSTELVKLGAENQELKEEVRELKEDDNWKNASLKEMSSDIRGKKKMGYEIEENNQKIKKVDEDQEMINQVSSLLQDKEELDGEIE